MTPTQNKPNVDQIALDTATAILPMYFERIPGVQLKAKIQEAVIDAIQAAQAATAEPVAQQDDFEHYAALEREHLGDPDKGTGIYHPANQPAQQERKPLARLFIGGVVDNEFDDNDIELITKNVEELQRAMVEQYGMINGTTIALYAAPPAAQQYGWNAAIEAAAKVCDVQHDRLCADVAEQIRALKNPAAEPAARQVSDEQIEERLEPLIDAVSDFRKATYEFAQGGDRDDHSRMIEAQAQIFAFARALLAQEPK